MAHEQKSLWDRFWRDKHGNVVIWQTPNVPILGWLLLQGLSMFVGGRLQSKYGALATALLFVWAYLELSKGANYFRKLLGLIVIIMIIIGFFKT